MLSLNQIDLLTDGYWLYHPATDSVLVSAGCMSALGHPRENLDGTLETLLEMIRERDRSLVRAMIGEGFAGDAGVSSLYVGMNSKSGERLRVSFRAMSIADGDDPNALLVLTTGFNPSACPLRPELDENAAFLALMAHDLRTPVGAIMGFSELLINPAFGTLGARQTEIANNINVGARQLAGLLPTVLELASLTDDDKERGRETLMLAETLAPVIDIANRVGRRKQIEIAFTCDQDARIEMEQRKLRRLVFRLLLASLKASPPEGTVSLFADEESVKISGAGERSNMDWDRLCEDAARLAAGASKNQAMDLN